MTDFTILRFEKLKTRGAVSASAGHMMRSIPTPNAYAERTRHNLVLLGSHDPAADVDARLAGAATRKNSVLAIEVLISASPEWFSHATREAKRDWMKRSQAWLVDHFGADNVVHLQLHVDEATPHLTGFIVPRDTTGRLNAARWLDGSKKLAAMQTGYTKSLSGLGLERGIEGSQATHVPPPIVRGMAAAGVDDDQATAELAQRTLFAERKMLEYQDTAVAMREAAAVARETPLPDVAEALGLARSKADAKTWVDADRTHRITFDQARWYDHKQGVGGGGAIDLVMHALHTGFREAVSWLGHEVGPAATARAIVARSVRAAPQEVVDATSQAVPFQPPQHVPSAFQRVRAYLSNRGISYALISKLRGLGRLQADERGNAVFVAVDAHGRARGAELRGTGPTPFHGHAAGSSRALPWSFDGCDEPRRLVICESAIDAMSMHELGTRDARMVSTGGAKPLCPSGIMPSVRAGRWDEVVIAYDNDDVGHAMADRLAEELRQAGAAVSRAVPTGKDWNEDLAAKRSDSNSFASPADADGIAPGGGLGPLV